MNKGPKLSHIMRLPYQDRISKNRGWKKINDKLFGERLSVSEQFGASAVSNHNRSKP